MNINEIIIIIIIYKSSASTLMPDTSKHLDIFNCIEKITNVVNPDLRAKITIDYPFELDYSYLVKKVSAHMPTVVKANFLLFNQDHHRLYDFLIYVAHESPNRFHPPNSDSATFLNKMFPIVLNDRGFDIHIILLVYLGTGPLETIFNTIFLREGQCYFQRVILIDIKGDIYIFERDSNQCNKPLFRLAFSCNEINITQITIAYKKKKFNKINNCEMTIEYGMMNEPFVTHQNDPVLGIDTRIMHELMNLLNFTVKKPSLNVLVFGSSKLSSQYLFITGYLTTPYYFDSYVYAMPKKLLQKSNAIVYIFTKDFWVLIGIAFILFQLVWLIISKYARETEGFNKFSIIMWKVFAIFIGQTTNQPNYFLQRTIFMVWALYALIIINAFTGSLLRCWIEPMYEPLTIVEEEISEDIYFYESWDLHKKWCVTSDCLKNVTKGIDYIFLPKSTLDSLSWELQNKHFHVVYSHANYISIAVYRYEYFLFINNFIKQIVESGIVIKWTNDVMNRRFVIMNDEHQKLTMEHFLLMYYLLIFGWVLATIAFAFEIFYYYLCTKKM